ncbi:hypothetical protein SAMN05421821_108193 [Mucilaginibacter lappiensis]|uniref:Xylosidase n=1 Tax=Mucilaginibacter lappiensis TaxID=354630 RepID=A0ABR6PJP5_9SPHI|nr:glycoside hydrolase family 71/99-like protein [Mucilaginibacter lappiensis]MBB6110000.1 hypothetical protein [Mucilaginibacter lappiensis]SIR55805.1 hypothetical protein SAMN05421821_108193 [Mucilaginibacter lappiensis]
MRKMNILCLAVMMGVSVSCTKKNMPADTLNAAGKGKLNTQGSPPGDVVGKLVVGYQGWFSTTGDGSPNNHWVHWAGNAGGAAPSPGHQTFELWPDMREYTNSYQTGYASLGNGQPAKLFSPWDVQTVNTHFSWMQQYGIDCAALQRFGKGNAQLDGIASRVMNAAQTYGRKFYVMYDISGWTNFQSEIKTDWTNDIVGSLHLTSSSAYAMQNGKPVICIWGFGVSGRPGDVNSYTDVINYFKNLGCYVIIGGPRNWRSQTANLPAFNLANMIMPWVTGSFGDVAGADSYVPTLSADFAYCNSNGIDYQAEVFPGFSWSNWNGGAQNQIPRQHGDLMWEQFANIRNQGIGNVYVGMFDEYDEATAIAKAAEDASMIPTNQYFLTLDADGVHVSSDYYLRLTNDGGKMIKGQIPLTFTHPTPFVVGSTPVTVFLDHCDTTTGWTSSNTLSVNTTDKQEGTGALQSVGSGTDEFKKNFTAVNTGATAANGSIQFWYYVSDASQFGTNNQIELGSGGAADVNEYNWNIGTLVNGWNLITKSFNTATVTGGTPNLSAINWFRIYHTKTASITTRVDALTVIH